MHGGITIPSIDTQKIGEFIAIEISNFDTAQIQQGTIQRIADIKCRPGNSLAEAISIG